MDKIHVGSMRAFNYSIIQHRYILKKQIVFSSFLHLNAVVVLAQEGISVSGGNATCNGGSVSYTIGQVVYTCNNGDEGSVAQGVQQPYEISVVSSAGNFKNVDLACMAYPKKMRGQKL